MEEKNNNKKAKLRKIGVEHRLRGRNKCLLI